MKSFSPLLIGLLLLLAGRTVLQAESTLEPDAGGVTLEVPDEGKIEAGTTLSVSFPAAMAGTDKIDLAAEPCPVRFEPPVAGDWLWKSQTDGVFTVKAPVTPGLKTTVRLAASLRNLSGAAVAPANWGAELHSAPFTVTADWEETDHLRANPSVVLKFTYPVRLTDVAGHIYFQDRDSFARQEAEFALQEEDRDNEPEAAVLRVTPRDPLPGGRTWDLIVENVHESASGITTPYLDRLPLGVTAPLTIKWLGGFNLPLESPRIRAHMDDYVDPDSVKKDAISVEPPVKNLEVTAEDEDLVISGDFDLAKKYRVTINPTVRGGRGYGLAAPANWKASFQPMPSALYFPGARVSERAALGLHFSFLQVHTGALRWRLAAVPLDKLAAVEGRVREFEGSRINPFTKEPDTRDNGLPVPRPTTLLVDTFGLATKAEGKFPASTGEVKDMREIRWAETGAGKGGVPAGAYLLEVDGPAWDGKGTVGQRSVVFFSESVITEKRTRDEVIARVAGMKDGLPRPGIPVRALSPSNYEVARGVTDATGVIDFSYAQLHPAKGERGGEAAHSLVADTPEGPSILLLDGDSLDETYVSTEAPSQLPDETVRAMVFTDRSLYRPGQTVHLKGLVRSAATSNKANPDEKLTVPTGASVAWEIKAGDREDAVGTGTATLDADGGWEMQWSIPADAKLGQYLVSSTVSGPITGESMIGTFRVEEYKVPLFEVKADEAPGGGVNAPAACRVRAGYFSGQPVAGAKVAWRVEWQRHNYLHPADDEKDNAAPPAPDALSTMQIDDQYSEGAKPPTDDEASPPRTSGEARLDPRGEVVIRAELPKNLSGPRFDAHWEIAVTSADGQSVASSQPPIGVVMRQPVLLGVAVDPKPSEDGGPAPKKLLLRVGAFDEHDRPVRLKEGKLELFHVTSKTVRETVAPSVIRYVNKAVYTSVKTLAVKDVAPDAKPLEIPRDQPGRYVLVGTAPGLQQVSSDVTVGGPEEDEVPVRTQTSLEIIPTKKEYQPGDTAAFLTRSPVSGVAWVSIETTEVIDTLLVPLPGNTTRIEFPVKAQYGPNAQVAIYLLRPGGGDRLPAERFGTATLTVRRPDRTLDVHPVLETARVRPGDEVRGSVHIVSNGKPIADADATVWAVDDALLVLGEWQPPELSTTFYPNRIFQVKTYAALHNYVADIPPASLFEKGFIIGGGGEEFGNKFIRKDFQPLAYWKTGLKTDGGGNLRFAFAAPDNLTRYRVVVIAQSRDGRFGEGEGSVEIAKPLIVEPSLPRFLRAGDEVELRAVARQSVKDRESVAVTCGVDDGLLLDSSLVNPPAVTVERDAPAVFRFRAKVPDGPATSAKITMRAGVSPADPEMSDGTEISLPILPPTILRRESGIGTVAAGGDVSGLMPGDAQRPGAKGHYDVTVSTSADLPRLRALPEVLEYPHGCFEQITSRVLVYCGVQSLLAGLPADADKEDHYKPLVQKGLALCSRSLLDSGQLPYWPGQKAENTFVTIQAAWAVKEATATGLELDDTFKKKISEAVQKIVADAGTPSYLRALGMMVGVIPASGGTGTVAEGEEASIDEESARAVYLHRESLGDEGRALLAVALHFGKVMADEKRQLLREILPLANGTKRAPERAFDPGTFATANRTESVAVWAMSEVRPPEWKPADAAAARLRLNKALDRAPLNSTQENLWALLAYHSLRKADNPPKLRVGKVNPAPGRLAPNGTAAEWVNLPIGENSSPFRVPTEVSPSAATALACVLTAEYRVGRAEEDTRLDRGGLRVERVVRNLTDPKRTGHPGETAMRLNDRLLVTYRLQTPKLRSYVALEDELPAGLETLNPDLPLFAPFYELPPTPPGQRSADLSSSELRDHTTRLYFDRLDPGVSAWSVLARVTTAGTFHWPATQAGPMYEPAVSGLAPSEQIIVSGE